MKSKTVAVKNIARLASAGEALLHRAPGMPGMGLVHGETGYGKTTAIAWYAGRVNAVYVRALSVWTPKSMFQAILKQLGREGGGSNAQMLEDIIEALALSGRPLFLDEADHIADSKRMTESLRDLHDMAIVPVVLVGMGDIAKKLAHRKQLTGRILQDVQFEPLDLDDTAKMAADLCEVKVRAELVAHLHRETRGSARLIVIALQRIEQRARSQGLDSIGLGDWGARELFTGEAPVAQASPKVAHIGGAR